MFANLIRGLLGAFGIIKKDLAFKKTEVEDFVKSLLPGTIILTRKRNPNFVQGGIQGASNSAWQHALVYFGKSAGKQGLLHEIVEAQGEGVIVAQLDKNFGDDNQMVAFTFNLDPREFSILKERVYGQVGKPYDYAEFLQHILPFFPNPEGLTVCSSLCTFGMKGMRRLVPKNVKEENASPGDIFNGCHPQVTACAETRYNW